MEGIDLSGKSYWAQKLGADKDIPIVKKKLELVHKQSKKELISDLPELITQVFFESIVPLGEYYDFILDRGLLSTLVFTKVFKRKYPIDYVYNYLLGYKKYNIKVNFFWVNDETLERRYIERGENFWSLTELKRLQELYIKFVNEVNAHAIKTENSFDFPIKIIENSDHVDQYKILNILNQ